MFHKERKPLSVNSDHKKELLKTMNWFDNPECEPNDYQKKLMAVKTTEAKLKEVKKEKKAKK